MQSRWRLRGKDSESFWNRHHESAKKYVAMPKKVFSHINAPPLGAQAARLHQLHHIMSLELKSYLNPKLRSLSFAWLIAMQKLQHHRAYA